MTSWPPRARSCNWPTTRTTKSTLNSTPPTRPISWRNCVSFLTRCAPRTLARESSTQVISHLRRNYRHLHLEPSRHSLIHHAHHAHHHDDPDDDTGERRLRGAELQRSL